MERQDRKQSRAVKRQQTKKLLLRLALAAFLVFAAVRFCCQQPLLNQYSKQISDLEAQIAQEEKNAQQIEDLKALYESDEYKQRLARERLGLVEPDERVFVDVSGK